MGIFYSSAVERETRAFVDQYGADIAQAIKGTGLFFSAVVAQKCAESQYGQSGLAKNHNNFSGIKNFGSLPGAGVVMLDTTEIVHGQKVKKKQPFATYETPLKAFQSYVRVLQDPNKKYRAMGVFDAATPQQQILLMAKAGYTTTTPDIYLARMKGIIYACKDYKPYGRIN